MICPTCQEPIQEGDWPYCQDSTGKHGHQRPAGTGTNLSSIHSAERSIIFRNPRTGEIRYPARADAPVPSVYAKQGYVREELASASAIKSFERSTGRIHERSHYDPGSATAEREANRALEPDRPAPDRALHNKLVDALR